MFRYDQETSRYERDAVDKEKCKDQLLRNFDDRIFAVDPRSANWSSCNIHKANPTSSRAH